jgi:hypothetical protein
MAALKEIKMSFRLSTWLAIGFLTCWFLGLLATQLTVIYGNFVRREIGIPKWKRWDCFGLLPRFAFFSWVPNCHYQLLFRDRAPYGEITPWKAVGLPRRSAIRVVWNPGRRKRFALEDLCRALLSHLTFEAHNTDTPSPYCFSYVGLVNYISQIPSCALSKHRQFMVAQIAASKNDKPEVLFISPFFLLSPESVAPHA